MALDVDPTPALQRGWLRHSPADADPTARGQPPPDSRWQRGTVVDALYLANDASTVWAEWYRHLAEAGIPPNQQLPRALWSWEIDPSLAVADLRTPARLARLGLGLPSLGRRTWPVYQHVGEALWREGWPGLVAPSAARPRDGLVLCLFRDAARTILAHPVPPPILIDQPPVPPLGMRT